MPVATASVQLLLEQTLKTFIAARAIYAAADIRPAHAFEKQPEDKPNYLSIIAGLPDWETMGGINAVVRVIFQPATYVADEEARPAQTVAHQEKLGSILELFTIQNIEETLAALNLIDPKIGFTGAGPAPEPEDGKTETQLAPALAYDFEIFLNDV